MNNLNSYISCLNCRINNLEENLNYVLCILENHIINENITIGSSEPSNPSGKDGSLYIQLKGGIFYEENNNKWNVLGVLEPLIVDGGDSKNI